MKRLSIITINFNNISGLRKTIESVTNQTFSDYEYIIIDGGSTDGSIEVIQKYADKIAFWVSESDNGIYHAMNKGISVAKGEYCLFLNSGDEFNSSNVLSINIRYLFSEDVICFDSIIRGNVDTLTRHPDVITASFLWNSNLCHQSTFIKTELLTRYLYDEKLKIVADWKFFILAFIKGDATYRKVNNILTVFHSDGISSKPENFKLIEFERNSVLLSDFYQIYDDMNELVKLKSEINLLRCSRKIKILQKFKLIKIF
jgi:glycosyltransferase involved in cell wall biosynthesis